MEKSEECPEFMHEYIGIDDILFGWECKKCGKLLPYQPITLLDPIHVPQPFDYDC